MSSSVPALCGNFLMLRTLVVINGKPAKAACDDRGWLTLNSGSPNTEAIFDSYIQDVDEVLQKHGMAGLSNYWCDETPLFEIKASSDKDVKHLLRVQGKIREELALKVAARLTAKLLSSHSTHHPCVEIHPEVYVMIPDYHSMDGKVIPVNEESISSCMSLCRKNGLHDLEARLMALHTGSKIEDKGPESIVQLEEELKEVVDWVHLGQQMGIPDYKLQSIAMANQQFPDICRTNMFRYWMESHVNRKWSTIVQALDNMGLRPLAIKIALKYDVPVPQIKVWMPTEEEASKNGTSIVQVTEKLTHRIEQLERKLENQDQGLNEAKLDEKSSSLEVAHMEEKIRKAEERIRQLLQEKMKLEGELQYKKVELEAAQKEIMSIKYLSEEKEKHLRDVIVFREQQVSECEKKLKEVKAELESEKTKAALLQELLQKAKVQLAEKSAEARMLDQFKTETNFLLKQERERMDKLLERRPKEKSPQEPEPEQEKEAGAEELTAAVQETEQLSAGSEAHTSWNSGAGVIYQLPVKQDIWLEDNSNKSGYKEWIIVGQKSWFQSPRFPKKRGLLQFESLPSGCTHIKWAKMYIYFLYPHKDSWQSVESAPYTPRTIEVYQVKQRWDEAQATSVTRLYKTPWNAQYLALDGSDANPRPVGSATIFTSRPYGFIEFDITEAMRNWQCGDSNHGVLLRASHEDEVWRDLCFVSRRNDDSSRHAFVNVLCD